MKLGISMVALLQLTGSAGAATTFLTAAMQVSSDGGQTWVQNLTVPLGVTLDFRMVVSFDLASGNALAWKSTLISQIDSIWRPGDELTNLWFRSTLASQTIGVTSDSQGTKLDRTDQAGGSILLDQLAPIAGADLSNPIVVLSFTHVYNPQAWRESDIVGGPTQNMNLAYVYDGVDGSNQLVPSPNRLLTSARVQFTPSPATSLLFCAAFSLRRQRRIRHQALFPAPWQLLSGRASHVFESHEYLRTST